MSRQSSDYSRSDDYDDEEADWLDCNTIGSAYGIQIDLNKAGHYRHRDLDLRGPWMPGVPPEGEKT